MQRLSMAAFGAVFLAVGTAGTAPAQAALLDFSFTTNSGTTGTFTLNTDAAPATDPALFGDPTVQGPIVLGISYPGAISNFSLSAPNSNLSIELETADFDVAPLLTSNILGLPPDLGVLSGAVFPSGCSTGNFSCLLNVAVIYSGDLLELPVLSDEPNSYSRGLSIDFFNPATQELLNREFISPDNLQVVPEPSLVPAKLAFGIGGAGLLLMKRKMNRKKVAIRP